MTSSAVKGVTAQLGIGGAQVEVPDWFQQYLMAALATPLFNVPKAFETWIVDRVAIAGLNIGIGQIIGFNQFVLQSAPEITASQATASLTYVDLATVGPTLPGIPDGTYVFFFGAAVIQTAAGNAQYMGLQVNATAPGAATQLISATNQFVPACRISVATLSNAGNNTVTAKYRVDAGTGTFSNRYLYGLRIANA